VERERADSRVDTESAHNIIQYNYIIPHKKAQQQKKKIFKKVTKPQTVRSAACEKIFRKMRKKLIESKNPAFY
jgi:hypothetical protein